jgi:hypothetical protein
VTIDELLPDGRPLVATVRFEAALEAPSLVWLAWGKEGYAPFEAPPVDGRVSLPPADFVAAVFGRE